MISGSPTTYTVNRFFNLNSVKVNCPDSLKGAAVVTIINDAVYWLLQLPVLHWIAKQPVGFVVFEVAVVMLLIILFRNIHGPEM